MVYLSGRQVADATMNAECLAGILRRRAELIETTGRQEAAAK